MTDAEERVSCGPLTAVRVPAYPDAPAFKRPIVFVHGMSNAAWCYRGLQEFLAERGHESYALNLRSSRTTTLESYVDDIQAALEDLELERPVISGHSQGGILVQHYCHTRDATMPEAQRVAAVALLGTAALGQKSEWWRMVASVQGSMLIAGIRQPRAYAKLLMSATTADSALEQYGGCIDLMKAIFLRAGTNTTTVTGKEISIEEYWKLVQATPADGEPTYGINGGGHIDAWKFKAVPKLDVPCAVVHFALDACYPKEHADWLVAHYGADFINVPGQAHCFADSESEVTFMAPLAEWLEGLE